MEQESVDVKQMNDSSCQAAQQHSQMAILTEVSLSFSFSEENLFWENTEGKTAETNLKVEIFQGKIIC